jgi:hypothetical protein
MKIVCVQPHGQWFTVGREYLVLAISMRARAGLSFRIVSDDAGTPVLAPAELFDVVPAQPMSGNWVAEVGEGGQLELGPRRWLERGFWERFFDGDADARRVFDEEVRAMGG